MKGGHETINFEMIMSSQVQFPIGSFATPGAVIGGKMAM